MATRKIRKEGDEVLRKECKDVKEINHGVQTLIKDMFETMYEASGVGLAAPQVGIVKKIVVLDDTKGHVMSLINPEIEPIGSETTVTDEGCLSLPGFVGEVERPRKIHVKALSVNGESLDFEAEDMLAVIIQHEVDHLHGILYKDKAKNYRRPD